MKTKAKDKIDLFMFIATIIIAILIIMLIAVNIGNLKMYFGENTQINNLNINSTQINNITKDDVILEKDKLVYFANTSTLTTKITNNGTIRDNLKFKVKFIANDGSTKLETIVYAGKIKANEVKYVDSFVTDDISNIRKLVYEVIK